MFTGTTFVNSYYLWLLLLLPAAVAWYILTRKRETAALTVSNTAGFKAVPSLVAKLKPILFALRMLALAAIIVALARPQTTALTTKTKTTRGIDIIMAIDVSSSMLARDLKPSRLSALKKVAAQFINQRPNDRIGIVVYSGESFTKTPVTSDKAMVLNALKDINYGFLEDGTAIGMGLATAVNRLKDSQAKSKIIILLTDGVNNTGSIDPETATGLAVAYNIKTYTIGIGTNGMALTPVAYNPDGSFRYEYSEVEIDEKLLKKIATETDGKYFRATDNEKLSQVYAEINKLEKTEIEELRYYNYDEKFRPFVLFALILVLVEWLLRYTLYKSFV